MCSGRGGREREVVYIAGDEGREGGMEGGREIYHFLINFVPILLLTIFFTSSSLVKSTSRLRKQTHKQKNIHHNKQPSTTHPPSHPISSWQMVSMSSSAWRNALMMTVGCICCSRNGSADDSISPAVGRGKSYVFTGC